MRGSPGQLTSTAGRNTGGKVHKGPTPGHSKHHVYGQHTVWLRPNSRICKEVSTWLVSAADRQTGQIDTAEAGKAHRKLTCLRGVFGLRVLAMG